MRYKRTSFTAAAVLLAIFACAFFVQSDHEERRYHQHIEAQEKEACPEHSDGEFCTHLPLIMINTDGETIPGRPINSLDEHFVGYQTAPDGSDSIIAELSVMDSETNNNHPSDEPVVSSNVMIHLRGHSSRYFDKPNYRIKLIDGAGENNPQPLLGMDSHHEWALHGPFLDKTLIRNYMWYNISGEIMEYAPNVRFCELMLNGEYQGVYLLTELIGAGTDGGRLTLEHNAKDNSFAGYLLCLDRDNETDYDRLNTLSVYTYRSEMTLKLEVRYPGASKITPELLDSIRDDFSKFEKSLFSYDYDNKRYGYYNFIDEMSFIDYFIINEMSMNYDAGTYSTYIYKDIDSRLKMCVWDFNNACDNYQEQTTMAVQHFEMQNRLWNVMLARDEDFIEHLISRYWELREGCLSEEYMLDYIDSTIEYLGPAVDRNFEKWGYSFDSDTLLKPAERNLHSYDEAVAQLKNFVISRGRWMDDNIESLRQYCAESKIKKYNEVTN